MGSPGPYRGTLFKSCTPVSTCLIQVTSLLASHGRGMDSGLAGSQSIQPFSSYFIPSLGADPARAHSENWPLSSRKDRLEEAEPGPALGRAGR